MFGRVSFVFTLEKRISDEIQTLISRRFTFEKLQMSMNKLIKDMDHDKQAYEDGKVILDQIQIIPSGVVLPLDVQSINFS